MDYLSFVVMLVPALIGLATAYLLGPNKGVLIGMALAALAMLLLMLAQVTPPSLASAWGLFLFEWPRWLPSYLVGAAMGALLHRSRRKGGVRQS